MTDIFESMRRIFVPIHREGYPFIVIGLILDSPEIKRIGAPVMGITLLISLAIFAWAALREPLEAGHAELEPA